MVDMKKEAIDTVISPDEELIEEIQQEGTDNDMEHNKFVRGDEGNLLGDGVPGYETTGEDATDDQIEDEITQTPGPMNTPAR